jgi:exodeoxyribonuclease VII large subunit
MYINYVNNIPEYTVTQLNRSIKELLEDKFDYIKLIGESGPITVASSGHVYFSIKENDEVISCICWKGTHERLEINFEEGTKYNFFGKVTSYSKFGRSVYQLIIDQIEYSGDGSILELIEKRKKDLENRGYFKESHKLTIPKFPKKIGILTSATGSVIHDIIHRIENRFPLTNLEVYPIPVQGKKTHTEIIEYLNLIETSQQKPDLIIFARGGGSLEEMMPFNESELIKRVYDLKIPSISAIGHETDYTLLDLVCDLRAPTPTAAAELSVPNQLEVLKDLKNLQIDFSNNIKNKIASPEKTILNFSSSMNFLSSRIYETENILSKCVFNYLEYIKEYLSKLNNVINKNYMKITEFSPKQKIEITRNKVLSISKNSQIYIKNKMNSANQNLTLLNRIILNSSIERNLKKGYSILKNNQQLIKNIKTLKNVSEFSVKMHDGEILIKNKN